MTSHHKQRENRKPGRAIALAWVAAVAVYDPHGAMTVGCSLLDRMAWAAFEVLRLLLLVGHWQTTSYLPVSSRILEILLQVEPCLWCLLHIAVGRG